ncbi:predicted protein [Sclerotinia sclerotiorum 1980 UF-70]|uniref:Uncharacterized protein n=1 Tax=Sclerotinia sclerotiorum (strain ATCC 18683 / 1980 / Ss-1) TaxID=665079 RepID=A7EQV8_SCLS1|nr:predicted protein [Sclerotinia sclerotiorum 1980 UF-70]EDN91850.1 predicted protein [Sclerotinia sclerotiorum 1980 UF-70]
MKSIPFYKVCKLPDEFERLLCRTIPLLPDVRIQKMSHAWISSKVLPRMDSISVSNPKGSCNEIIRNDIGYHVERIMKEIGRDTDQGTIFSYKNVTVEEIEDSLIIIAAQSKRSSPAIRSHAQPHDNCTWNRLEEIYLRLQGPQAKWLTRIIHKNLGFVVPDEMVLSAYHTSFPRYLQVTAKFNIRGLVPVRRDGQTGMIFGHPPPQIAEEIPSKDKVNAGPSITQSTQSVERLVSPPATKP